MDVPATDVMFKVLAGLASLFGIANLFIIKPMRDRVVNIERRVDDTFSKSETEKQIDLRQKPLELLLSQLNDNISTLNSSALALANNMREMELLQQRMLEREKHKRGRRWDDEEEGEARH